MPRLLSLFLLLIVLSTSSSAIAQTLSPSAVATSTSATNTYSAASEVTVAQPVPADLITAGASVTINAPVQGDILAAAGVLAIDGGAGGDVRVAGGRVRIAGDILGDVAVAGGSVTVTSSAKSIYVAGGTVVVSGSSAGDVTIYGVNVTLSGTYSGNVHVVASSGFTLGEGTRISGTLRYSAPDQVVVPEGTVIENGARYTGPYTYLPTEHQAQFALFGVGIFFAVRTLAAIIMTGLIAGLFPSFSRRVSHAIVTDKRAALQYLGIGVSLAILTPILCLFLLISFVGAELALMLVVLYAFLALLSSAFCGIALGYLLHIKLLHKYVAFAEFSWRDAVVGTVCIHLIGLLPLVGNIIVFVFAVTCAGALAAFAYHQAFSYHE